MGKMLSRALVLLVLSPFFIMFAMEMYSIAIIYGLILLGNVIFGCISSYISYTKGYDSGFAWGFFLGVIGLLVVGFRESKNKQKVEHPNPIRNKTTDVNSLKELASLYKEGLLTEDEFKKEKEKIINK